MCPNCRESKPLTKERCGQYSKKYGIETIKVYKLKSNYKNYNKTCDFKCKNCNYLFSKNWAAFVKKPGCPRCGKKYLGEFLCKLIFETLFGKPFPKTRN